MSDLLPKTVLIMAGGTGGHVFPALAAAHSLQQRGIAVEWLGTTRGIESKLVPAANIPIHYISVSGLRGKNIVSAIKACFQLLGAIWQSLKIISRLKPICVLGMGGFASGPGGFTAWLMGRPLVIHEQNAVAGTTNKLLANFAEKILQGYPMGLGGEKGSYIGNPVREEIVRLPAPEQRGVGRSDKLKLLVLGGSLGAKPINELLPQALSVISENDRPEVWHQTGAAHVDVVKSLYDSLNLSAKVEAFITDMAEAYSWADLVICRAGALTVAELMSAGVASVLVPLPHAIDDHQTANARWLSDNDAAELIPQASMSKENISAMIEKFNTDRTRLMSMACAARSLAKNDAAEQVANICLEVARG